MRRSQRTSPRADPPRRRGRPPKRLADQASQREAKRPRQQSPRSSKRLREANDQADTRRRQRSSRTSPSASEEDDKEEVEEDEESDVKPTPPPCSQGKEAIPGKDCSLKELKRVVDKVIGSRSKMRADLFAEKAAVVVDKECQIITAYSAVRVLKKNEDANFKAKELKTEVLLRPGVRAMSVGMYYDLVRSGKVQVGMSVHSKRPVDLTLPLL